MAPTTPSSPDVPLLASRVVHGTRECRVTASVFTQQLATLPFKTAWRFYCHFPHDTSKTMKDGVESDDDHGPRHIVCLVNRVAAVAGRAVRCNLRSLPTSHGP